MGVLGTLCEANLLLRNRWIVEKNKEAVKDDAGIFIMMKLLLLTTLILTAGIADCGKDSPSMPEIVKAAARAPVGMVPTSDAVIGTTTKGVTVRGAFGLSQQQKDLIDIGIEQAYSAAIEDGFRKEAVKPFAFYHISIPPYPCIPSTETRTPSFVVNGGAEYDGTIYDQYNTKGVGKKDGISVVFASEMVLSIGTPGSIPEHGWLYVCPDASVLANAVKHGTEHIYLANFPYNETHRTRDPYDGYAWFYATVYHGPPHPLLPRHAGQVVNELVERPPVWTTKASPAPAGLQVPDEITFVSGRILKVVR